MTEYYTDNQGGRHAIPNTWSFSRWAAWDECAFKYRAKFILKVPEPQSPAMARGDRVHRALDSYITGRGPLPPEITSNKIVYPDEASLTPLEFGAAATLTDPGRAELMARFKSA